MFVFVKNTIKIEEDYVFRRHIPDRLKIIIEKDKKVTGDTVIARGEVFQTKARIDIASELKIKPKDTKKFIECLSGERIEEGDIIARRKNIMLKGEKTIKSPCGGVIDISEIEGGFILIADASKETAIYSGIEGRVKSVVQNKHIDIECKVLKIKPFHLYGKDVQGELFYIPSMPKKLPKSYAGSIIAINTDLDLDELRVLSIAGIKGVILGSFDREVLAEVNNEGLWGMSICLCEGFGDIPLEQNFIDLLKKNNGHICLFDSKQKEIIFTNTSQKMLLQKNELLVQSLKVGDEVQVFDPDNWKLYGSIEKLEGEYAKIKLYKDQRIIDVHTFNIIACLWKM
jgi:hypothetical protein